MHAEIFMGEMPRDLGFPQNSSVKRERKRNEGRKEDRGSDEVITAKTLDLGDGHAAFLYYSRHFCIHVKLVIRRRGLLAYF